ncbi:single-stranded DNA-binding protein [Streptomyces sp. NPDC127084]|uniref:single-stranded DNA-binding protein n=1 Tax=Streptomyces sp. NPDC127084 TaxID=3347133 RepID=UPI003655F559
MGQEIIDRPDREEVRAQDRVRHRAAVRGPQPLNQWHQKLRACIKDTQVRGVHDGRPARRSVTIQTSKTHLEEHPITLSKGTRVVVAGRLRTDRWESPEGEKRSRMVLDADDMGRP